MIQPYDEIVDLPSRIGKPPRTWKQFFKSVLYWIFPPTLVWGALSFIMNKLLGRWLGKTLMRQPKQCATPHTADQIYEVIAGKNAAEPPHPTDVNDYLPRQFYTPEEACAQAVLMDCMDYGKEALSYTANDKGSNPYQAVGVRHVQLMVNETSKLDTYFCEYPVATSTQSHQDKLAKNAKKIAVISCPGRARSGRFLLPSLIRNALTYCKPNQVFKNWRATFTKGLPTYPDGLPKTDLLDDFKPYSSLLNVTFDYRGIKDSVGQITSDSDMVEDIMSVVFHLFSEGYLPENIVLKGHSLGGVCVIAAEKIQALLSHLDDPNYHPYFRKLFGRTEATEQDFRAFLNHLRLHGPLVRGAATRSFGNLPWTIAQKCWIALSRKGFPKLGKALTRLLAPFLAVFGMLVKFDFNVTKSFLRLRLRQAPAGFTFFAQKGFTVRSSQKNSEDPDACDPSLGDQTIPYPAALGTLLKDTWVERMHRAVNGFLRWISKFRSHEFESHHHYMVYEQARRFSEKALYRDEKSKALQVDYEATPDNVEQIHDKASERVQVHGLGYDLEKWFFMRFIPNCQAFTRDYCEQSRADYLDDPDNLHQCHQPFSSVAEEAATLAMINDDSEVGQRSRQYFERMICWALLHCKTAKHHLLNDSEANHRCVVGEDVMQHVFEHYKRYLQECEESDNEPAQPFRSIAPSLEQLRRRSESSYPPSPINTRALPRSSSSDEGSEYVSATREDEAEAVLPAFHDYTRARHESGSVPQEVERAIIPDSRSRLASPHSSA